jgi:hypothetical protein
MSSAKPTDAVPQARVIDQEAARQRTWALLRRLIAGGAIAVGWGFIAWHNHFHLTPSVLFLALGWLSVVLGVLYVWQTTVATADPADEQAAWWLPAGARDELELEKRSLLKAIKEIEFDHELGKTSKVDADEMSRFYRARAIEVIKALDALDGGGSVRDEIEREAKARRELAAAGGQGAGKAKAKAGKGKASKGKGNKGKGDTSKTTPTGDGAKATTETEDKKPAPTAVSAAAATHTAAEPDDEAADQSDDADANEDDSSSDPTDEALASASSAATASPADPPARAGAGAES